MAVLKCFSIKHGNTFSVTSTKQCNIIEVIVRVAVGPVLRCRQYLRLNAGSTATRTIASIILPCFVLITLEFENGKINKDKRKSIQKI